MEESEKPSITIPLMSIKLEGESDFVKKFNAVSDLYHAYEAAPEGKEKDDAWQAYFDSKLALEMGY